MRKIDCTVALTMLLAGACAGGADETTETVAAARRGGGARRGRVQARPCRADVFYVDVPLQLSVPWTGTSFLAGFGADLETDANQPGYPWFCGADAITCPSQDVQVAVSSVLPNRAGEAFRGDGHLRFFRIRFQDTSGSSLSVRPSAQCDVVARIRSRFENHSGAASDMFFTGRECDASAMGVEGAPSTEMEVWHLERMGLSASAAGVTAPPDDVQTVDLALVDSGVVSAVGTDPGGIGLASETDLLPGQTGLHAHGTGMAVLSRQVAPNARLHSLRTLGAGGAGTSEALASALDEAVYGAATGDRPLIVNLSLGWPSELGRAARITSGTCSSWEDPFGEPVRYLLDAARRSDDAGLRRVFVTAAAGNQPIDAPPGLFPPEPYGYSSLACSFNSSPGADWYYPANWNWEDSCRSTASELTRVAFGVSVVDDRDLVAGNAIANAESPLVAPGQHVYATHPNATPTSSPTAPQCGATTAFPPPVTLPRAYSGSSVGAALVSAAAARAQASRIASGDPAFDWDTLARLLYLTGEDLCRTTPAGVPVRRLNVARLDQTLSDPACAPLATCAGALASAETIPAGLLQACKSELAACRLERLDSAGNLIPICPGPQTAVEWPATYASPVCFEKSGPTLFQDAAACGGACPFEAGTDRKLVGSLGPQPDDPTCPDCLVYAYGAKNAFDLIVELNPNFPPGTTFSSPFLVFKGTNLSTQTAATFYLDLLSLSEASSWTPGANLKLEGTLDGMPAFDWEDTKAVLTVMVQQPGMTSAKDVSALRLKAE